MINRKMLFTSLWPCFVLKVNLGEPRCGPKWAGTQLEALGSEEPQAWEKCSSSGDGRLLGVRDCAWHTVNAHRYLMNEHSTRNSIKAFGQIW